MIETADTAIQALQVQAAKLLKARKTTRPVSTLAPLMTGFGAWTDALGKKWRDSPEGAQFRSAAFDAWDMESERDWTKTTIIEAQSLTERFHALRPAPEPLPPLDPTHPESLPKKPEDLLALLWRHLDHAWLGAFFGVACQKLHAHLRPAASGGTIFELLRRATNLLQGLKTKDTKDRLHMAMVAFKLSVYLEEANGIIQGALNAGMGIGAAHRAGWRATSYAHLTGPSQTRKDPASKKESKAHKAAPPFDPFAVAAVLLEKQQISRPVSTLPHLLSGYLDAWRVFKPSTKQVILPGNMLLGAAFQAWHETTWIPWSAKEGDQIAQVLEHFANISGFVEVLPALPIQPPFPPPQEILEACWRHIDVLGLRAVWYMQNLGLEEYLPEERSPFDPLRETVHLADQVAARLAHADHDADLRSLLLGIAQRLEAGHRMLDQCIETARGKKRRIPAPPSWMRPTFFAANTDPVAIRLPAGADGQSSELPLELRSALAGALAERKCARPLETAIPLVRAYVAWHLAMNPDWRWMPEMDGRECSFMLFEATMVQTPPWEPEQARCLLELTDALYRIGGKGEVPSLPPFASQQPEDPSPHVLWRHVDRLVCALTLGIMGMELMPSPRFDSSMPKSQKDFVVHMMDIQVHLFIMLTEWPGMKVRERKEALAKASKLLDGFQRIAHGLLSEGAPQLLDLLPIVPYPVALTVDMPQQRKGKRR